MRRSQNAWCAATPTAGVAAAVAVPFERPTAVAPAGVSTVAMLEPPWDWSALGGRLSPRLRRRARGSYASRPLGVFVADEGDEALVLLLAGRASLEVGAHAGHELVGAGDALAQLDLDVAVE